MSGCRQCQGSTWHGWEDDIAGQLSARPGYVAIPVRAFMDDWQQAETGGSPKPDWNPFAVAKAGGGTSDFNEVGVMNFNSPADGATQTANRIRNYPGLYAIFRDNSIDATHIQAAIPDLRRWGSNTFADKLAGGKSTVASPKESAGAADWTSVDLSSLGINPLDWLSGLMGALKFFLWLLDPVHILRLIELIVGLILLLLGVWALVKVFSQPTTDDAGTAARKTATKVRSVAKVAEL